MNVTELICRAKNENDLKDPEKLRNKPKVFFSCHPDDFEGAFDAVCEDIFRTHDCVIYCRRDLNGVLPPEIDLGRMTLFVFAVTFRLLRGGSLATEYDLPLAKNAKRPILPIVTEHLGSRETERGFNALYGQPELFGNRQYLNRNSSDITEISYADKLKKYLDATLIDDKTAELIREEFDAYIFLSYRKTDRQYANELMKLIHSEPACRSLAIWFDEFLTPGEDFNEAILKAVKKSRLFTLLVTQKLLENDNFIMKEEYPAALRLHKNIFPAGKEPADYEKLSELYPALPEVVSAADEELFRSAFLEAVKDIVKRRAEDDPNHDYLIGLAFLDGIDVEINVGYGEELLTRAGEAGLSAAMKKLYDMYGSGSYVSVDYEKAFYWAEKLYRLFLSEKGENDRETLEALHCMAVACRNSGKYREAAELLEKCYASNMAIFGEKDPDTLKTLNDLSWVYNKLGDYQKAMEFCRKSFELCSASTDDPIIVINALRNLSTAYYNLEDFDESLELDKMAYEQSRKTLGEKHHETLKAMNCLAASYSSLGDVEKEVELFEKCYRLKCEVMGEEHPETIMTLNNLALSYDNRGDHEKAFELKKKCYEVRCRVLGEEHPETIVTLNNLALSYGNLGDHDKEIELDEKCLELRCRALGEDHPETLKTLYNLAITYGEVGNHRKEAELDEKCWEMRRRRLGDVHPDTLATLRNLYLTYEQIDDGEKELEAKALYFTLLCGIPGKADAESLGELELAAHKYSRQGNHRRARGLYEKAYEFRCRMQGSSHPDAFKTLRALADEYDAEGSREKAAELRSRYRDPARNTVKQEKKEINEINRIMPEINGGDFSNKL